VRQRPTSAGTGVLDALDECTSESENVVLVSLLDRALREPGLSVVHVLLTTRSESHIHKAIDGEDVCPLVCKIPMKTSEEGVTSLILPNGADVDSNIHLFVHREATSWSQFPAADGT